MSTRFIGVAGASCSGKSTLSRELAARLPGAATVLSLDSYYVGRRDGVPMANFDHPDALDWDLIMLHLLALRRGEGVDVPTYSFVEHRRSAESVRLLPGAWLVVEGLHVLLYEDVRGLLDTSVFVAADDATCLARRLERDVRERGRPSDSVIRQYETEVRPMRREFIDPTERHADVIIDGRSPTHHAVEVALRACRAVRQETPTWNP